MHKNILWGGVAILVIGGVYLYGRPEAPSTNTLETTSIQNTNNNTLPMNATLHTNKGDITIEFNAATPKTVENFAKLARDGFYNGTKFHRVIKGFMNQGGDPLTKDDAMMSRWGTGGPGYQFADEIGSGNRNDVGTISMANAGPNTNGSQFFINVAPNNFLDAKHTVFGRVVAGMDVVMDINSVETGEADRPLAPVVLERITLN
jgi:peptidylprolyl isomerase